MQLPGAAVHRNGGTLFEPAGLEACQAVHRSVHRIFRGMCAAFRNAGRLRRAAFAAAGLARAAEAGPAAVQQAGQPEVGLAGGKERAALPGVPAGAVSYGG